VKLYFQRELSVRRGFVLACVLGFCAVGYAQNNATPTPPPVRPGTAKMAALLEDLNRKNEAAPKNNAFANEARVEWMRSTLSAMTDPMERAYAIANIAVELLNAGEVEDALTEATNAVFLARQLPATSQRFFDGLEFQIALTYLRKGEQDNCIQFHGPESCLLPFRASAVHKDQEGSRAAIAKLTDVLAKTNEFVMSARWLLNIAYMTGWRIPAESSPAMADSPQCFCFRRALPSVSQYRG
jgi:hypothetical protein